MIRYFYHKIGISLSLPHPIPRSAFRAHTSAIVARAKVNVSRSFYQCHVIHDTHISCGSDDVTHLSEQSERQINVVQVRLRHIHVSKRAPELRPEILHVSLPSMKTEICVGCVYFYPFEIFRQIVFCLSGMIETTYSQNL